MKRLAETMAEVKQRVDDAGSDPGARLDALLRSAGFRMLDDQVPYRRIIKVALEHWFGQVDAPERSVCRFARAVATSKSTTSWLL